MDQTKQEIKELCSKHSDILDGKQAYGEGDAQTQARRFWLAHLAELIIERAREKLLEAGRLPKVDLLVSVAGFSPETTIVTAGVFKPQHVLVISSERAYDNIDTIGRFLMDRGLRPSQFHHERCDPADLSLFEVICRRVRAHRETRARGDASATTAEILVDITGGKKVMSAAAAMAAWELDLRISYVNNVYDTERRIAISGTEEIVLLDSPYLRYGDADLRRADHDFDLGAYEVARARYEKLADRLNEPARARFLRDLSTFYDAWRNLDIDCLRAAIRRVRERLSEPTPIARRHSTQIETQLAFVERLIEGDRAARIMTLFLLGEANMAARRYDFSALLFYRTIEASIAGRLELRYPGFACEDPKYDKIDPDVSALKERFQAAAKEVFGGEQNAELPLKIGCLDGAVLLRSLKDDLLVRAQLDQAKALSHLRNLTTTRNRSILAHGYQSVSEKDCKALRASAEKLLAAYWALDGKADPFQKTVQELRFLRLEP